MDRDLSFAAPCLHPRIVRRRPSCKDKDRRPQQSAVRSTLSSAVESESVHWQAGWWLACSAFAGPMFAAPPMWAPRRRQAEEPHVASSGGRGVGQRSRLWGQPTSKPYLGGEQSAVGVGCKGILGWEICMLMFSEQVLIVPATPPPFPVDVVHSKLDSFYIQRFDSFLPTKLGKYSNPFLPKGQSTTKISTLRARDVLCRKGLRLLSF